MWLQLWPAFHPSLQANINLLAALTVCEWEASGQSDATMALHLWHSNQWTTLQQRSDLTCGLLDTLESMQSRKALLLPWKKAGPLPGRRQDSWDGLWGSPKIMSLGTPRPSQKPFLTGVIRVCWKGRTPTRSPCFPQNSMWGQHIL